ncbi:phage tail sheath subtilisin-like domain-containing protein [Alteraurantiacibacter buctensis]|uniref:Phage tail protein n=1 Tax=Alteraurantiacibacter buctensis TaxID=1503981 RepID=A0A844Z1D7_9SPHN|nr:phage tail sheath subtilisin-like domain-containing protein [Alteraurantiacibacter buctensis]MXO73599.1 phage tail protein [Alteraurantiacibacter buctensis]
MPGLTIVEQTSGPRSILPASLAVIGLVATATAAAGAATTALNEAFPLNTPVLIAGDVEAAAGNAGSGGTLGPALRAIADQASPYVIVVRVAEGEDAEATEANVIGATDGNSYTGIQALLAAESQLGFRPRILGAPGLDSAAVVAELVIAAQKLRAMVYASAIGDDVAEVVTYRETYAARELMLIWPDTSAAFSGDIVARTLGLRARIDEQQGWHKTVSNVPLGGITGLDRDVHFDLLDPSTEAGALNDAQVTTVIRQTGFRLWGNRTCADVAQQPEFSFESAVRTSHALQDEIASIFAPFLDQPMTQALIKDLVETGNARFRQLVREGRIVGAQMFFDKDANSSVELAAGRPKFRIQFTPAAPLENPRVDLVITDFYYAGFTDLVG